MNRRQDPDHPLYRMRHSLAHVLAKSVLEIRPNARLGYGPPTENGFFYDFELHPPLTPEDFPDLERRMRRIIAEDLSFERSEHDSADLIQQLQKEGHVYKAEMAQEFYERGEKTLTLYTIGDFPDLCLGCHLSSTGSISADAFCLDGLAGAYWKSDSSRPMLQRVQGLAFENAKALRVFLDRRELARARDHRRLGAQLEVFTISEEVGKGLPLWMPNGTVIKDELERLACEMEFRAGYQRVSTPHLSRAGLYHTSGHLPYYAESMFPPMHCDDEEYYLKPMNCPHHHMIFKARPRSHRELPLRFAEYGMCYRYEQSGELAGLLRVRALEINDAHIYCTPAQVRDEFIAVMRLHLDYYRLFGIDSYWMRLSLPDLEQNTKYVGGREVWEHAEQVLHEAMRTLEVPYEAERGEAAFYGPKIDMQIRNVVGREETASTNQLDLIMGERFGLVYTGPDNQPHHPHIIHRAPLGSHERFIAFLLEHYGGAFPTWLAPVQVRILPVSTAQAVYAHRLQETLRNALVRAEVDASGESLARRMRTAQTEKIPNLLICGEAEQNAEHIAWRRHGEREQRVLPLAQFHTELHEEIANRKDWRTSTAH